MQINGFFSPHGNNISKKVNLSAGTLAWGLLAKSHAAKNKDFINGTLGTAKGDDGKLLSIPTLVQEYKNLNADQLFNYANVRGENAFINAWEQDTIATYPQKYRNIAKELAISPVTTCGGLTGGLTIAGQLFLSSNDKLLVPNSRWGNVDNVFFKNQTIKEETYNLVTDEGKLDVQDLLEKLKLAQKENDKIGLYLNFPNNPSGISPNYSQIGELQEFLSEIDFPLIIILDDAYEGYVYEKDAISHSLFPLLIGLNENILTIKIDGLSKRYSSYGARLGLITIGFGSELGNEVKLNLREDVAKVARTLTSSSPRGLQEAFTNVYRDGHKQSRMLAEKQAMINVLGRRYSLVKKETDTRKSKIYTPAEFNSGFFAYYLVKDNLSATKIAEKLMKKGLGTVPFYNEKTGLNGIRLAFCSIKETDVPKAIDILYSIERDL